MEAVIPFTLVLKNFFLKEGDMTPKSRETQAKINRWDYMKLNSLRTVKDASMKQRGNQLNEGRYL